MIHDPNHVLLEEVKDFLNQLSNEIYQDQEVEEIQVTLGKIVDYICTHEVVPT